MKCLPNLGALTRRASTPLLLLVMTCLLAGCSQTSATRTDATDWTAVTGWLRGTSAAERADAANRADLCKRGWRPVTYSSRDTEQTQLEVRAVNSARATFCGEAKP